MARFTLVRPTTTMHSRLALQSSIVLLAFAITVLFSGCGGGGSSLSGQNTTAGNGGSSSSGSSGGSSSGSSSGSGSGSSSGSGSGSSTGSGSGGAAPQATGTTISNLQTQAGNWQSFAQIAPAYADCAAPCKDATWKEVYGVSNPSKSGNATEYSVNPLKPGADVLYTASVVGTTAPQRPDADHKLLPTLHDFTYDADFYVQDSAVTSALEFDISQWMEGITGITFGTQCAHLVDGDWDIFNNQTGQWLSTGAPCQFVDGWNHVTIELERQSNNDTLYKSITLNGTTYTINKSYPPASAPAGWWGLAANFQVDSDSKGDQVTAYVDNLSITYR